MKTTLLNTFCTFLLSLVVTSFCSAQVKQVHTKHTTFVLDGINQVKLDVGTSQVDVRETKGSRVLIEITASAEVPNESMMNFLVESGRYELISETDLSNGTLVLSKKKNNNVIVIKGKECIEEVSYVVYIPSSIKYVNTNMTSSTKQ